MPSSCGVSTAPMGPGYTDPYAWPPIWRYTGQALRHAPHRMHASVCRVTGDASMRERPLTHLQVGVVRDLLLDSHEREVGARQAGGQPRVPFVFEYQYRARLGDS